MGGKNSTQWISTVIGNTNRAVGKGFHTENLAIHESWAMIHG